MLWNVIVIYGTLHVKLKLQRFFSWIFTKVKKNSPGAPSKGTKSTPAGPQQSSPPPDPWSLQWRHYEHDCVSSHQPHDCLLNRLFRHRWKKTSKLRATGLCEGNSPVTGEFPAQRTSNAENVSIWWRHHVREKETRGSNCTACLMFTNVFNRSY